ncbi:uncharacterized protein EI90DRAFT_2900899 [Cantharellus anzutake]|uniref:uncharacterized protein n=1 Tax=Cantharellus anzutake TaxID=1750568 RepID=UPI001905F7A1|nr:uncharacterized protein EI90DRAFT_2900899 [Cantharellus anzutake]KAF8344315.1 hypothetical protein EI90DRAFT_2900899 [Cantharellus anzutake]
MAKQRYLTLAYEDMETIKILPPTFADAVAVAKEWVRPPPGVPFQLRVPVEYASIQASRLLQGPYLYIDTDDTYQLAQTSHGLRMEIVTDAPPPPEEEVNPPPPPPPPILEMPATFNLELTPGRTVALETNCESDDLDMSRTEDGMLVEGSFWGVLKIIHQDDNHSMDFSGTRLGIASATAPVIPNELFFDSRVMAKLMMAAARPTTAKCALTILAPSQQYCDVNISLAPMWRFGTTYPTAEPAGDRKIKYFLRGHPDGYLEHFESNAVVTSLYYEALPDTSQMDPVSYISPSNGFAMPLSLFIPHISKVLDDLGLSISARTLNAVANFANHKHIAYRFMQPARLSAAIDLSVSTEPAVFTRIFLMWRGVSDEEMVKFADSSEKEADAKEWKEVIGFSDESKDISKFRVLETSIMECVNNTLFTIVRFLRRSLQMCIGLIAPFAFWRAHA